MKANLREIRKTRHYSEEFKRNLVSLFEKGKYSVLQLEKLYGVSNPTIYNWIYKFSTFNKKGYRIVEKMESSQKKVKDMQAKIKELEAALGRKQIMIEYFETMMEVAKEELNIDIKKNYGTLQSGKSTKKKNK
ncbi:MAG: transposase [Flavobacteriaceae bacterium]|nr:transposase [Flavobacteriaceae bacterium]